MSLLGEKTTAERIREVYDVADAARENILAEREGIDDRPAIISKAAAMPSYSQMEARLLATREAYDKLLNETKYLRKEFQETKWIGQMVCGILGRQAAKQKIDSLNFTRDEIQVTNAILATNDLTREQVRELLKRLIKYAKTNAKNETICGTI